MKKLFCRHYWIFKEWYKEEGKIDNKCIYEYFCNKCGKIKKVKK